jgi:predicted phosphodiesterase
MTDDLSKDLEAAYQKGDKIPADWRPYTEQVDQIGKAIVRLPRPNATEHDLLVSAGFDPEVWRIDGPINARKWMAYDGRWLHYFKFSVVQGESAQAREVHIDELTKLIRRRARPAKARAYSAKDAWAYVASDWQIGKAEGGQGTPETVDRVLQSVELAVAQVRDLRRIGRQMPTGAIIGLGDLVEGCTGFYPAQEFTTDATRRDQNRITRELLTHAIDNLSPLFDEFTIASVGGNHGENRRDGRAFTTPGDNDDLAVFEAVREAFTRGGEEFAWIIPQEELSIGFELGGVPIGATHGHLFGNGATPAKKAHEWWIRQAFGEQAVQHARILLSGHLHHFMVVTYGGKTHIQVGAMDPGSAWFRQLRGEESPAGALTLRFDAEVPSGYDDLRILTPRAA